MSSRRGWLGGLSSARARKRVEEVAGVVRARAGLGVVLDRRGGRRPEAPAPRPCGRRGSAGSSSAAPKSVSQRTGSSASIRGSPPGPSTAKPWFWEVMSIRPPASSLTGWLAPRWPNGSL